MGTGSISWNFAPVGFHLLSRRLPYIGVFPFTLLHLPLNFNRVSSLQLMYLHPSVNHSLTNFLGELLGLGLALVPDVVVPEANPRGANEAEISFQRPALTGV